MHLKSLICLETLTCNWRWPSVVFGNTMAFISGIFSSCLMNCRVCGPESSKIGETQIFIACCRLKLLSLQKLMCWRFLSLINVVPSFMLVVVVTLVENLASSVFPTVAQPLEGSRTDILYLLLKCTFFVSIRNNSFMNVSGVILLTSWLWWWCCESVVGWHYYAVWYCHCAEIQSWINFSAGDLVGFHHHLLNILTKITCYYQTLDKSGILLLTSVAWINFLWRKGEQCYTKI